MDNICSINNSTNPNVLLSGSNSNGAPAILLTFFLIHISGARIYGLSLSGGLADWMYLLSITMYVFPNVTSVKQVNNATPNTWSYFVGWVVKYLVVKFGGMRVHDEVLIPLVAGVGIGSALCWFIGGVVALPKYIGG